MKNQTRNVKIARQTNPINSSCPFRNNLQRGLLGLVGFPRYSSCLHCRNLWCFWTPRSAMWICSGRISYFPLEITYCNVKVTVMEKYLCQIPLKVCVDRVICFWIVPTLIIILAAFSDYLHIYLMLHVSKVMVTEPSHKRVWSGWCFLQEFVHLKRADYFQVETSSANRSCWVSVINYVVLAINDFRISGHIRRFYSSSLDGTVQQTLTLIYIGCTFKFQQRLVIMVFSYWFQFIGWIFQPTNKSLSTS